MARHRGGPSLNPAGAGGSSGGAPTGSAGGDLTGTYPNPTLAAGAVDLAGAEVTGTTGAANGGTGRATLTSGSFLTGNGTGTVGLVATPIGVANGGTGAATLTGLVKASGTSAMTAVAAPAGAVVGDTDSQTLTNKTLTAPVIATIANTGTVTLPTATDTLVGRATTDTLTNKAITPRVVALTDAATISTGNNSDNADVMTVTLGGNRTMGAPSGTPVDGQRIVYRITQDSGAPRTLAWTTGSSGNFAFSSDLPAPTLSTANSKIDYVTFIWSAASSRWHCVGVVRGF